MVFLPDNREQRQRFSKIIEEIVASEGQRLLGWRKVPTDNFYLGETAKAYEPFVRQIFIGRGSGIDDDMAFERKLYVIRRRRKMQSATRIFRVGIFSISLVCLIAQSSIKVC